MTGKARTYAQWYGPRGGHFEVPVAAKVILWDKDSTLAHTQHRQHIIDQIRDHKATWLDYSMACSGDGVFEGAASLFRLLAGNGVRQFIVSGANCEAEPEIRSWCRRHFIPYDGLALRSTGNHQKNADFKIAVIRELRQMMTEPVLMIEDWAEAAQHIHTATGIPVMCVNPCYEVDLRDGAGA